MGQARTSPVRKPGSGERLQRILARAGLSSRREAERWIEEGRVRVNGRVVRRLGSAADPSRDAITVDGKPVPGLRPLRTYVLYKPRGVVTTTRDPRARKTVLGLVPRGERLFPVGRLDAASEGLLLLTNDGALAHRLMHPSFEVPRVYRVSVQGRLGREELAALRAGQRIEGRPVVPRGVTVRRTSGANTVLEVTLIEGRRRQIRTMMREVGHPVRRLVRIRFGPVQLGTLAPGTWRPLRVTERQKLERMLDAAPQIEHGRHRRSK
ncbi:MAG: pseudouridine synthase [Myxococcota bacterium]